jgi:hypothetical protein
MTRASRVQILALFGAHQGRGRGGDSQAAGSSGALFPE